MTEHHEHVYGTIELVRVTKIDNDNYKGVAGDKAFLMRSCPCGDQEAFDYGPYDEMGQKLKQLEVETA